MRRIAMCAVLLCALGTMSGCELLRILGLPWGDRTPYNPKLETDEIAIQRNVQFNDIPVPMAFKLRRNELFSYRCPTFRLGDFLYEGAWPYRRTKAFYDEQMPIAGWSRLAEEIGDKQAVQYWAKGSDRARILYDNSGDVIAVRVRIYPVGSEPAKPELR
ncbi:MAG: hypothetical protein ACOCX4_08895 [Planctomycetota bacterium]